MEAEIAGCPWCERTSPVSVAMVVDMHGRSFSVECAQCGSHGPVAGSYDEAVQQWSDGPRRWRPISEAPIDGTEVILGRGERVTFGHWFPETEAIGEEFHNSGEYLGTFPTGEVEPASWLSWDGGFTPEEPPTHYQPLPKGPCDE